MKVNCATGTPDQMIEQFKGRISELEGIGIDSSFDYPDDLIDLENGEYESHATEPVNAASEISDDDMIDWLSEHDQAYQDCQDHFGVDDLYDVPSDDIYNWICDHDRLFEDFMNHFGHEAVGVEECDNPIQSSFVYPDDLEDMENGEYESHATEPIKANSGRKFPEFGPDSPYPFDPNQGNRNQVLNFLSEKGYDVDNIEVKNYADAVAEYLDMCEEAWADQGEDSPYTIQEWYEDTMRNYPDELEDLPRIDACDSIMSAQEFAVDDKIVKQVKEFFEDAVSNMEDNIIMELASKVKDYNADWASEDISDPASEDLQVAEANLVDALVKFAFSSLS